MAYMRCVVVLLVVLMVDLSAAGKRGKKNKKDDMISEINARVDAIEDRIEAAHGSDGGSCAGNNVHFYFHGDEDDHDHEHDGGAHVHVHISDNHDDHHSGDHEHHEHVAICQMTDSNIAGTVKIFQGDHDSSANFSFDFTNLEHTNSDYDFHVHQFGDLSDQCSKVGKHFNLYHKDIDVGDLGTFEADASGGIVDTWNNNTHLTMFGEYCILGRSIMAHAPDGKMGCCIIGVSPDTHDHDTDHSHEHEHFTHGHDSHDNHVHDHDHSDHGHSGHDHDSHDHHLHHR